VADIRCETIPADGTLVRLDGALCRWPDPAGGRGRRHDRREDFHPLVERTRRGPVGTRPATRQMRERISRSRYMDVTAEDVQREQLTREEVNGWRRYMGLEPVGRNRAALDRGEWD